MSRLLLGLEFGEQLPQTTRAELEQVIAALQSYFSKLTISGDNTGDQFISLSGDVSGSGTTGINTTIVADAVTNSKLADMAASTLKGRGSAGGSGDPEDLTLGTGLAMTGTVLSATGGTFPLTNEGNSGTTKTIDLLSATRGSHRLTLTGNVTLTLTNPLDGGAYVLLLYTGAGSFTVTWPATVEWPGGTGPTITTAASKVDLVTLIYDSTAGNYYGSFNQSYAA